MDDRIAHKLFETLSKAAIKEDPWQVHVTPTERIEAIGSHRVVVPAPTNFETYSIGRFLINLRDATAHGDTRNASPFHITTGSERLLAGFRFACSEVRDRRRIWEGKIILLESDMRRIGIQLAKRYCDALRRREPHRRDRHFGGDAATIREAAA
jgi:hypothetical protein